MAEAAVVCSLLRLPCCPFHQAPKEVSFSDGDDDGKCFGSDSSKCSYAIGAEFQDRHCQFSIRPVRRPNGTTVSRLHIRAIGPVQVDGEVVLQKLKWIPLENNAVVKLIPIDWELHQVCDLESGDPLPEDLAKEAFKWCTEWAAKGFKISEDSEKKEDSHNLNTITDNSNKINYTSVLPESQKEYSKIESFIPCNINENETNISIQPESTMFSNKEILYNSTQYNNQIHNLQEGDPNFLSTNSISISQDQYQTAARLNQDMQRENLNRYQNFDQINIPSISQLQSNDLVSSNSNPYDIVMRNNQNNIPHIDPSTFIQNQNSQQSITKNNHDNKFEDKVDIQNQYNMKFNIGNQLLNQIYPNTKNVTNTISGQSISNTNPSEASLNKFSDISLNPNSINPSEIQQFYTLRTNNNSIDIINQNNVSKSENINIQEQNQFLQKPLTESEIESHLSLLKCNKSDINYSIDSSEKNIQNQNIFINNLNENSLNMNLTSNSNDDIKNEELNNYDQEYSLLTGDPINEGSTISTKNSELFLGVKNSNSILPDISKNNHTEFKNISSELGINNTLSFPLYNNKYFQEIDKVNTEHSILFQEVQNIDNNCYINGDKNDKNKTDQKVDDGISINQDYHKDEEELVPKNKSLIDLNNDLICSNIETKEWNNNSSGNGFRDSKRYIESNNDIEENIENLNFNCNNSEIECLSNNDDINSQNSRTNETYSSRKEILNIKNTKTSTDINTENNDNSKSSLASEKGSETEDLVFAQESNYDKYISYINLEGLKNVRSTLTKLGLSKKSIFSYEKKTQNSKFCDLQIKKHKYNLFNCNSDEMISEFFNNHKYINKIDNINIKRKLKKRHIISSTCFRSNKIYKKYQLDIIDKSVKNSSIDFMKNKLIFADGNSQINDQRSYYGVYRPETGFDTQVKYVSTKNISPFLLRYNTCGPIALKQTTAAQLFNRHGDFVVRYISENGKLSSPSPEISEIAAQTECLVVQVTSQDPCNSFYSLREYFRALWSPADRDHTPPLGGHSELVKTALSTLREAWAKCEIDVDQGRGARKAIPIPDEAVGLVIGKSGCTIRTIQSTSNCSVQINKVQCAQWDSALKMRDVFLAGPWKTIEKAVSMLQDVVISDSLLQHATFEYIANREKVETAHVTETLVVDETVVSALIGRSGENIRSIELSCSVRVQVSMDEEISDSGPGKRRVVVSGNAENVAVAKQLVRGCVSRTLGVNEEIILLPEELVGVVIGRGGEKIKQVKQISGVRTHLGTDIDKESSRRALHLLGSAEEIAKGKELIFEALNTANDREEWPSSVALVKQEEKPQRVITLHVPESLVGLLIGKGGDTVKSLQQTTKTKIHVQPFQNSGIRNVQIAGSEEAQAAASQAIQELLAGRAKELNIKESTGDNVHVIRIPHNFVAPLIGRQGENIKRLQDISGARTILQDDPKKNEKVLKITGSAEAVESCKELVDNFIGNLEVNESRIRVKGRIPVYGQTVSTTVILSGDAAMWIVGSMLQWMSQRDLNKSDNRRASSSKRKYNDNQNRNQSNMDSRSRLETISNKKISSSRKSTISDHPVWQNCGLSTQDITLLYEKFFNHRDTLMSDFLLSICECPGNIQVSLQHLPVEVQATIKSSPEPSMVPTWPSFVSTESNNNKIHRQSEYETQETKKDSMKRGNTRNSDNDQRKRLRPGVFANDSDNIEEKQSERSTKYKNQSFQQNNSNKSERDRKLKSRRRRKVTTERVTNYPPPNTWKEFVQECENCIYSSDIEEAMISVQLRGVEPILSLLCQQDEYGLFASETYCDNNSIELYKNLIGYKRNFRIDNKNKSLDLSNVRNSISNNIKHIPTDRSYSYKITRKYTSNSDYKKLTYSNRTINDINLNSKKNYRSKSFHSILNTNKDFNISLNCSSLLDTITKDKKNVIKHNQLKDFKNSNIIDYKSNIYFNNRIKFVKNEEIQYNYGLKNTYKSNLTDFYNMETEYKDNFQPVQLINKVDKKQNTSEINFHDNIFNIKNEQGVDEMDEHFNKHDSGNSNYINQINQKINTSIPLKLNQSKSLIFAAEENYNKSEDSNRSSQYRKQEQNENNSRGSNSTGQKQFALVLSGTPQVVHDILLDFTQYFTSIAGNFIAAATPISNQNGYKTCFVALPPYEAALFSESTSKIKELSENYGTIIQCVNATNYDSAGMFVSGNIEDIKSTLKHIAEIIYNENICNEYPVRCDEFNDRVGRSSGMACSEMNSSYNYINNDIYSRYAD